MERKKMKAVIAQKYGTPETLKVRVVNCPTPKKGQVLIHNFASSINSADLRILHGRGFMMRLSNGLFVPKNKIFGCDISGRVVSVASDVEKFKIGDEVYGCVADLGMGGYAEYVTAPESTLAIKLAKMSFEQAAAIPLAGVTAFQANKAWTG